MHKIVLVKIMTAILALNTMYPHVYREHFLLHEILSFWLFGQCFSMLTCLQEGWAHVVHSPMYSGFENTGHYILPA